MPTEFTADGPIESTEAFENALLKLVQTAQEGGVDPSGAYESRTAGDLDDVEIEIVRLAKADR